MIFTCWELFPDRQASREYLLRNKLRQDVYGYKLVRIDGSKIYLKSGDQVEVIDMNAQKQDTSRSRSAVPVRTTNDNIRKTTMHSKMMNLITSKLFIRILYHFTRIYSWTFRLTIENEKPWLDNIKTGSRVLICSWHQQFFSFIRYFKKYKPYKPSLMISQSKDGDIVAGVAKLTGWYTARGSSSKDGQKALQDMIRRLRMTGLAAHIVDGPRGPAGYIKKGAINLAMGAEAVIIPVYAIAEKAWYFNSWDHFLLPKPFSKVTIRFGDFIEIKKTEDADLIEKQRKNLEEIMLPALHL